MSTFTFNYLSNNKVSISNINFNNKFESNKKIVRNSCPFEVITTTKILEIKKDEVDCWEVDSDSVLLRATLSTPALMIKI